MEKISLASGSLGNNPILERVLKESLSNIDPKILLNYSDCLGLKELRKQISKLYQNITEENIMITSSAQQALAIIFNYFKPKEISVQEPAYFGVLRVLKNIKIKALELEDNNMIYLTSNYNNPTGKTLSLELKQKLSEFKNIIIEDNPHDFVYFEEEKPKNIFEISLKNKIYISGFSKILGPGLRVGYIIADENLISKLKSEKITIDIFTSTLCQKVCSEALKQDYLKELRNYFRNKRDIALYSLEEHFRNEDNFIWNIPKGGIFILGEFSEKIVGKEVIKIAKNKNNL